MVDYSDLLSEDTWVGYLRTRLPYSFSEIQEIKKGQCILSGPLLSTHLAEHHNFWKRGYVYYAAGKLIDIYRLSVYWREYRILHTDKLRNEHSGTVDHLSKLPRDVFNALQLVVPVKQTVTYRASFGHVELFQEYRKPLRSK